MRWIGRILIALVLIIVLLVAVAFGYDRVASSRVLANYPPQGEILTVDGLDVHTICMGAGDDTLILFHGFAGGAIDMLPLMDALQDDMRVCAFDRPGNDYSAPLPADWSIDDELAWHQSVISALSEDPVYIGGHSLGGAYMLAYAAQYPTQGIISLDGLSPQIADTVVERMGSYSSLTAAAQLGLLRPIAGLFVSPEYDDETLRAQMTALRSRSSNIVGFAEEGLMASEGLGSETLAAAVENIDVPMLILVAEDTDVPEGAAFTDSLFALDATYPDSTMILIGRAPHYLIASDADEVATWITGWMQR